jgi:hypothetical protein
MVKNAHFFDIDILIKINSNVWVVDKNKPNIPIIKISQSEFNLIESGIYKGHDAPLEILGKKYWLPKNLEQELRVKSKNLRIDISKLAFSMQEFSNKNVINNIDYRIYTEHINHLKNKTDDIYIICSKNNKKNYSVVIDKLETKLLEIGLNVKNYYYLSETFYNRDSDYISHRKAKLLIQHAVGYKTEGNKFSDEEIVRYDRIYFYDDEQNAINLIINSNSMIKAILSNTDEPLSGQIKKIIKESEIVIAVNEVTHNKMMPFNRKEIIIECPNIIKTYEAFKKL